MKNLIPMKFSTFYLFIFTFYGSIKFGFYAQYIYNNFVLISVLHKSFKTSSESTTTPFSAILIIGT